MSGVINEKMMGGPSDKQDPARKALLMKKMFSEPHSFNNLEDYKAFLAKAKEWNAEVGPVTLTLSYDSKFPKKEIKEEIIELLKNENISVLNLCVYRLGPSYIQEIATAAIEKNPSIHLNFDSWTSEMDPKSGMLKSFISSSVKPLLKEQFGDNISFEPMNRY